MVDSAYDEDAEKSISSRMNHSHEVANSSKITCFLSTKKGKLQEYELVVTDSHLRVFSWTSGSEKTSIELRVAHAKKV